MSKKQWFLGACGALLIGGLANSASANFKWDLRIVGVDDVPVADPKYAVVDHVGQRIQVEGWLTVKGTNGVNDEAYSMIVGSLLSYKALDGQGNPLPIAAKGTFVPAGAELDVGVYGWYTHDGLSGGKDNGGASQNLSYDTARYGKMLDDGSLDVGSNVFLSDPTQEGDWFKLIAAFPTGYTIPGAPANEQPKSITLTTFKNDRVTYPDGFDVRLLKFDWVVTEVNPEQGKTNIGWMPRMDLVQGVPQLAESAGIWRIDLVGGNANTRSDLFEIAPPIVLEQIVPEPAGLSILALGALGLLARRRK